MADNTVFDSVFKTMVHKSPQLLVPFVNEAFGRNYPYDTHIVQFSNEHEEPGGSVISDSVFKLEGKVYHVECQSTPDSDMVIRMVEYDFAIALEGALAGGAPYEMDFPESCVLFLRHTSKTPDALEMKVNLPNGESFVYAAKVVKAQLFSSEDLFNKHLLLLLPYYLMRYEKSLELIAADDLRTAALVAECSELRSGLEAATLSVGDSVLYEELTELIIRVSDYMFEAYDVLRRKVRRAMGGEVLELLNDRAKRLEREAEQRGIEQGIERGIERGIEQGIERGIEQGIEQGISSLSAKLEHLGVDARLIDEAIAELRSENAKS